MRKLDSKFIKADIKNFEKVNSKYFKNENNEFAPDKMYEHIVGIEFNADDIKNNTDDAIKTIKLESPVWGITEIDGIYLCENLKVGSNKVYYLIILVLSPCY